MMTTKPHCRRCLSAQTRLVGSASDDRGTIAGPLCYDERGCERRRIREAIGKVLAVIDEGVAKARGARARDELRAYRNGLRVGFTVAGGRVRRG